MKIKKVEKWQLTNCLPFHQMVVCLQNFQRLLQFLVLECSQYFQLHFHLTDPKNQINILNTIFLPSKGNFV